MRIHPLMAGAAVSVMLVSLVGVAAITGYLPGSVAKTAPDEAASAPAAKPAPCPDCGVVVAVRQVEVKGQGTGLGAVAGGVAGAVVGREITDGKDLGTLVGAAGGAFAGHQIERHARTTKRFHVDVRMSDGTLKTVTFSNPPSWRTGDRVRFQNGKLISQDQPARTVG